MGSKTQDLRLEASIKRRHHIPLPIDHLTLTGRQAALRVEHEPLAQESCSGRPDA